MRGVGVGVQRGRSGAQKEGDMVVLLEVGGFVLQDTLVAEDGFVLVHMCWCCTCLYLWMCLCWCTLFVGHTVRIWTPQTGL